jgi:hypothetical protein
LPFLTLRGTHLALQLENVPPIAFNRTFAQAVWPDSIEPVQVFMCRVCDAEIGSRRWFVSIQSGSFGGSSQVNPVNLVSSIPALEEPFGDSLRLNHDGG